MESYAFHNTTWSYTLVLTKMITLLVCEHITATAYCVFERAICSDRTGAQVLFMHVQECKVGGQFVLVLAVRGDSQSQDMMSEGTPGLPTQAYLLYSDDLNVNAAL